MKKDRSLKFESSSKKIKSLKVVVNRLVAQIASPGIFYRGLKSKSVHHNYQIIEKNWNMVLLKKETLPPWLQSIVASVDPSLLVVSIIYPAKKDSVNFLFSGTPLMSKKLVARDAQKLLNWRSYMWRSSYRLNFPRLIYLQCSDIYCKLPTR